MTVIVYKCDTCKREKEILENEKGLESIYRCTITKGCHGKLTRHKVLKDFIREQLSDDVVGLDNWVPRNLLYNHTQHLKSKEWVIEHNLQTFPSIQVYVYRPIDGKFQLSEIVPEQILPIDENNIKVIFNREYDGIAQLIARNTKVFDDVEFIEPSVDIIQVSNSQELTILTQLSKFDTDNIILTLEYTNVDYTITTLYAVDRQPSIISPWVDYNKVLYKGKLYDVRSFNINIEEMASGLIKNNSTVKITHINGNPIIENDCHIVMANPPFETFDKVVDKIIDCFDTISKPLDLIYNTDIYARATIIKTIYPYLRRV